MDTNDLRTRRRYQHHVEALLTELADRRQRINVLQTWGVQPTGLRDLMAELQAVRVELAAASMHESHHDGIAANYDRLSAQGS